MAYKRDLPSLQMAFKRDLPSSQKTKMANFQSTNEAKLFSQSQELPSSKKRTTRQCKISKTTYKKEKQKESWTRRKIKKTQKNHLKANTQKLQQKSWRESAQRNEQKRLQKGKEFVHPFRKLAKRLKLRRSKIQARLKIQTSTERNWKTRKKPLNTQPMHKQSTEKLRTMNANSANKRNVKHKASRNLHRKAKFNLNYTKALLLGEESSVAPVECQKSHSNKNAFESMILEIIKVLIAKIMFHRFILHQALRMLCALMSFDRNHLQNFVQHSNLSRQKILLQTIFQKLCQIILQKKSGKQIVCKVSNIKRTSQEQEGFLCLWLFPSGVFLPEGLFPSSNINSNNSPALSTNKSSAKQVKQARSSTPSPLQSFSTTSSQPVSSPTGPDVNQETGRRLQDPRPKQDEENEERKNLFSSQECQRLASERKRKRTARGRKEDAATTSQRKQSNARSNTL